MMIAGDEEQIRLQATSTVEANRKFRRSTGNQEEEEKWFAKAAAQTEGVCHWENCWSTDKTIHLEGWYEPHNLRSSVLWFE